MIQPNFMEYLRQGIEHKPRPCGLFLLEAQKTAAGGIEILIRGAAEYPETMRYSVAGDSVTIPPEV